MGTSWMVTTVNRKPIGGLRGQGGADEPSVRRLAQRGGEDARVGDDGGTPHQQEDARESAVGAAKKIGDATQHAPLITSAATAAEGDRNGLMPTRPEGIRRSRRHRSRRTR